MLHNPNQQLESLVISAVSALKKLPDDEQAPLLTEMQTIVFRRAAESYGLRHGMTFADAFVNAVARRMQEDLPPLPPEEILPAAG